MGSVIIPAVNPPAVSVILPAYNAEVFITEAVESVRAQTFSDYELIAVNDGSTDRTGEILDDLAKGFPAMRVIHQENKGLAGARNAAIAAMRGEYIALLDADDLWLPEKLQRCMDYLREHPDESEVYYKLKMKWSEMSDSDAFKFTEFKTDYVNEVLAKAKSTRNAHGRM